MIANITILPNQVTKPTVVRMQNNEHYNNIAGFPIIYIDRYSYISGLNIRTPYGEPETPDGAYSVHIGAFNSISWSLNFIIDQDHDYKSVTIADCELLKKWPPRHRRKGSVIIQNDVWIGQGCTVFGGVTIHNGAVVAGNSVVTKDVPPYTIVGGAPARVIKTRFAQETIDKMQAIQWWDWSKADILKNQLWFTKEPAEFADHFYAEMQEKQIYETDIPGYTKTYLFFPDFEEKYGIWRKVILDFCRSFAQNEECGLVLFIEKNDNTQKYFQQIEALVKDVDAECGLFIFAGNEKEEESVFSQADYYITSRSFRTVKRTCLADKFSVPVISGVDIPMF